MMCLHLMVLFRRLFELFGIVLLYNGMSAVQQKQPDIDYGLNVIVRYLLLCEVVRYGLRRDK